MLLWSGQVLSSVGTNVSGLAFPLLVLLLTQSPAQAGFASALRALPFVFLGLPVGALIDRWNRKWVMILSDTGRALALGSIPVASLTGHLTIIQLYLTALAEGVLFVFFNIAQAACLPKIVPKEQLPAATGQNQAVEGTGILIGPPLGGLLYGVRPLLPFLADALSYAVSVGTLLLIRTNFQPQSQRSRRNLWVEIGEGVAWLWRQPLVRFMALLTSAFNFVQSGVWLIIIVIAELQGASPPVIGLIATIGAIGSILAAVVGAPIQKRFRFGAVVITTCWVQALVWPLYALAPNPLLLGIISTVLFLNRPIFNTVSFSYRLALIPDGLQGRVNSIHRLIAFAFQPVGFALTGVLLEHFGPVPTILLFAVFFVIPATAATLNPHVRFARQLEVLPAK
jgi:MFS family permease